MKLVNEQLISLYVLSQKWQQFYLGSRYTLVYTYLPIVTNAKMGHVFQWKHFIPYICIETIQRRYLLQQGSSTVCMCVCNCLPGEKPCSGWLERWESSGEPGFAVNLNIEKLLVTGTAHHYNKTSIQISFSKIILLLEREEKILIRTFNLQN